jgi:hypothetical protein
MPYPTAPPFDPARSSPGSTSGSLPGSSADGLHASSPRLPPTQLGVGPPRPSARMQMHAAASPSSRRILLAVAALLALGVALGVAVALTGT